MTNHIRGLGADLFPPDLEPVPTARELALQQLARVAVTNAGGDPSVVTILPEGQRLIYEAMSRNAERMAAWHETGAHRPRAPVPTR